MKLTAIRGIVWDLDGTLLDSFGIFEQIIADLIVESGHIMPSHEFMLKNYHGSLEETIQRILNIDSTSELDRVITNFLKHQEHHYADDLNDHLFQDAAWLAQRAATQGIHQVLITNRAHANRGNASPKHIIAATVLADYIHEVYPGDEVEFRKPDKRSLGDWMQRYSLEPHEVIVIGDQYVDAQLALNAGTRALLVKRNDEIPHLDQLSAKDHQDIKIVDSLDDVEFAD